MNYLAKFAFRALLMMTLAFAGVSSANAQELSPSHLDLAKKYVEITDQNKIYEVTLIETGISTMRTIISQNPEITEDVSSAIGKVIEDYSTQKAQLFDQFARVYALRFTEAELREIVAFYETDVGKKLAEQNALANQELQTVMRVFQQNLNNEFYAKVRAELREQGIEI